MSERKDIAAIQARLIASFPNYHPADIELVSTVWLEILADLPADLLKIAVLQYSSENHDFAPSAGTVRDYAMRIQVKSAGIPDAYQAYDEVCKMPADMTRREWKVENEQNIIYEYRVSWSHQIVEQVANTLGWPKRFPTSEPGVDRAQFIKSYDTQLSRQLTDAARLPVVERYIEQSKQNTLPGINQLSKRLEMK
jgi:hypothetical protein